MEKKGIITSFEINSQQCKITLEFSKKPDEIHIIVESIDNSETETVEFSQINLTPIPPSSLTIPYLLQCVCLTKRIAASQEVPGGERRRGMRERNGVRCGIISEVSGSGRTKVVGLFLNSRQRFPV